MNIDKIGKFILKLRNDKNLTQEELAEKIPISRQAISKWERGLTIPDSDTLIKLSEIFNVSINEILAGDYINSKNENDIINISLKLYDDRNRKKKIIKFLSFTIICILFILLIYYYITSYRSIKVYTISGSNNNFVFNDGIFVRTNEKLYFRISDIYLENDLKMTGLELYYLDDKNNFQRVYYSTDDYIMFIDYLDYSEYFNNDIDYIINNIYLRIYYDKKYEDIKLKFQEDYVNDWYNLFKSHKISLNELENGKTEYKKLNNIENRILKSFEYKNDGYFLVKNDINFFYDKEIRELKIIKTINGNIEQWIFSFSKHFLNYINASEKVSFDYYEEKINCISGECSKYTNKIAEFEKICNYF